MWLESKRAAIVKAAYTLKARRLIPTGRLTLITVFYANNYHLHYSEGRKRSFRRLLQH